MLIPELRRAVYVSVGEEPAGVPPQVLHAGGGPIAFLDILHDQLAMREIVAQRSFPEPNADPAWRFEVKGFDPFREREVETWLTVANGETGTRGALEEGSAISTPATFVAGVYGDGTDDPPFRQPVPAPDWTGLRLMVAGSAMSLSNGEIIDHERVLDMRHGIVFRSWRQRLRSGRTRPRAHGAVRLAGRPPGDGGAGGGHARRTSPVRWSGRAPSACRTPAGRPERRSSRCSTTRPA